MRTVKYEKAPEATSDAGSETMDLRKITRPGAKSTIRIAGMVQPWILAGRLELHRQDALDYWEVGARLKGGATDVEHDSAWAFRIHVVGLAFVRANDGHLLFRGYIQPLDKADEHYSYADFRVPAGGFDVFKGAEKCDQCKGDERHMIVNQYVPPVTKASRALYDLLQGRRCEISISAVE